MAIRKFSMNVKKSLGVVIFVFMGFSACSLGKKIAVYKYVETDDDVKMTYTATFYKDNTFVVHIKGKEKTVTVIEKCNYDFYSGTYSGDPTQNGEITITITKEPDWTRNSAYFQEILKENKKTFSRTKKEFWLKELDEPETEMVTITDGIAIIEGDEYKKQ